MIFRANALMLAKLRLEILMAGVGAVIFFAGVLSVCIFLFRFRERDWPFLSFGFFAVITGIGYLNLESVYAAFDLPPRLWLTVEVFTSLFLPVGIMALVEEIFASFLSRFIRRLWQFLAVFAAVVFTWFQFAVPPPIVYTVANVIQLLCVAVAAVSVYKSETQTRVSKTAWRITVAASLVLIATALADLLRQFGIIPFGGWFLGFGILALIAAFGYALFDHYGTTTRKAKFFALELETNKRKMLELEQANLQARFQALKNQINPHFLFNTLGTLMALIEEDRDLAADYVLELSNVYRYLLQTRDKRLVTVGRELEFVASYTFLVSKRYGKSVTVSTDVDRKYADAKIPPLSIQLLLENALKHNVISSKKPLKIEIFTENDGYITVRNNLQQRTVFEKSHKIGLSNLKNQYLFFTDKKIVIMADGSFFTASIPLLEIESESATSIPETERI